MNTMFDTSSGDTLRNSLELCTCCGTSWHNKAEPPALNSGHGIRVIDGKFGVAGEKALSKSTKEVIAHVPTQHGWVTVITKTNGTVNSNE